MSSITLIAIGITATIGILLWLGSYRVRINLLRWVLRFFAVWFCASAVVYAILTIASQRPTITPSQTPVRTEAGLCEWFVKTQFLRSERISAEVDLGKVFRQENPDPANFLQALKGYRPHQDEFITGWQKLGPHPEAREFWDKELSSVQTRARAFDAMIEGLENDDQDNLEKGVSLFEEASKTGNEAETAMLKIRAKCIDQ